MFDNLRRAGAPYGIEFGRLSLLPNSRPALAAGEFARDQGRYEAFHDRLFKAYFTETRDIGRLEVLLEKAEATGLDPVALEEALRGKRYESRLDQARQEADSLGVHAIPTFFINGAETRIVGAQSLEVFQKTLRGLG